MVRTQIQLTEEQARRLKAVAGARGVSMAELIRQSVDSFVRTTGGIDPAERRKRAMAIAGRFRSGVADLGRNHDRYLDEAYKK